MKKYLFTLLLLSILISTKATIHEILVWQGYYQFMPANLTIELGDTIQWLPLDEATMFHTITSDEIPMGAAEFDQIWQLPADTFFQYVPEVIGLYNYVCTPHIELGMVASFTVVDPVTDIQEFNPIEVVLYPNPCIERARISLSNIDFNNYSSLKGIIQTLDGKIVQEMSLIDEKSSHISFYTKELDAGIYILSILGNKKVLKSKKLLVL